MCICSKSSVVNLRGKSSKDNIKIDFKIPKNNKTAQPSYQGEGFAVKYSIKFTF